MKLAFSTLGCPDYSFRRIVDTAAENGIHGIEIRGIDGIMDADKIPELMAENIINTKSYLKDNNVELVGFGTSCNFHNRDNIPAALEEGKKAMDVCALAGIPNIRVFGDVIDLPQDRERIINDVSRCIGELCEYNKSVGVIQEIHGSFNTAQNILPVIESNRHRENFGILWDIQHSDKIYGDNWREFYAVIKPYIKRVHIKDHARGKGLTLVGQGDIPIRDIVKTLIHDGYNGYFSFEWEKKWVPDLPEFPIGLKSFLDVMKQI